MNEHQQNWLSVVIFAGLVSGLFAFGAWHIVEAGCQKVHNVYDCEWSRTPFTPKELEQ